MQVCCSGHGKNGSLCVLRQSIRPEVITEVCPWFSLVGRVLIYGICLIMMAMFMI